MPSQKVKGVSSNGIIIVSDARIDDLIGKVAHELLTSPRGRNNFGTGVCRRVRFRSCGTVGYGPTMWLKVGRGPTSCTVTIVRRVRG